MAPTSSPKTLPLDSGAKKLSGNLLKDKAYAQIKAHILADGFEPGAFLSERQVSAWLGMSKTPIKAAFERLEQEGFLNISPQQGVVVRDLTIQEIVDHFELRSALETYVARNLAGHLRKDQVERLEAILEEQRVATEKNDSASLVSLDGKFHLALCDCLGNGEISRVINGLKDKIFRIVRRVYTRFPDRSNSSFYEHRKILDAIIGGESEQAAQLIIEHLENGKRFLLQPRR